MSRFHRAPLFVVAWLASFGLLLVFVILLATREHVATGQAPLVHEDDGGDKKIAFPDGFGALRESVPFSGGIAPIAAEVVSVEHAPEFQTGDWLRSQDPDAFTIQVLAAKDEEVVKRYLASRSDRSRYTYFLHTQDGGSWYVVTTGRYATVELARGVADAEDFGVDSKPFPKRVGAYQMVPTAVETAP